MNRNCSNHHREENTDNKTFQLRFFLFLNCTSALFFIRLLMTSKPAKSSKNVR
nr:hypothetical protein [uncultured bacterium]